MHKIFIYIKFSLKALIKYPGVNTLIAITKFAGPWYRLNDPAKITNSEKLPWLCFSAIDRIKKILKSDMVIFEYGSGGSTLFWASRVKEVVSIEHDRLWYGKMSIELADRNITNLNYILSEPEPDNEFERKSFENPGDYISEDANFTGKKFEIYAKQIDYFADQYFDIVIVDGRARPSCILHALKKVKTRGFIIVDNTDRKYYLEPFQFNKDDWNRWDFTGPVPYNYDFSRTTILQKKK
jgi:hypothetical protein